MSHDNKARYVSNGKDRPDHRFSDISQYIALHISLVVNWIFESSTVLQQTLCGTPPDLVAHLADIAGILAHIRRTPLEFSGACPADADEVQSLSSGIRWSSRHYSAEVARFRGREVPDFAAIIRRRLPDF
ncbi:hypothetical protein B0H17DRAFT_1145576 [Mycena rosella]|uniref:Uncharacterized protein n=1 Tax=Mycena rosella TaxID=1033263 RepID=A0AAD7CT96_MYCRO|nr:hypothetical protein B0H17DRAFT_1145576 [Mycena rosella]